MSDLLADTATLVDIASVSRNETDAADHIEKQLRSLTGIEVIRIGDNVVARTNANQSIRVLLAGHIDTVPPAGNASAVIEGDRCSGVGSGDMKGGLAVMLAMASRQQIQPVDCTYVFYAREEVARSESGLLEIAGARDDLLECDVAVLLEPTSAYVEAGCQGVVRAVAHVQGRRAHVARPWIGENAVHRLGRVIAHIAAFEEREPVLDGCRFHESMQAVRVQGGIASNVVPDEAQVEVSFRYAPDRDVRAATAFVAAYLGDAIDTGAGDRVEIVDAAPAAPPSLSYPLARKLVELSEKAPRAKLGWTDVAFFSERGIPAMNFGPGDPELAHGPNEFVARDELDAVYGALVALTGGV